MIKSMETRLLERSVRDPITGCLEWIARTDPKGYGTIHYKGRERRAHHVALIVWRGYDPTLSDLVCHHCNNRPCIEPDHLYVGTAADNARDAASQNRMAKKLSIDNVNEICRLLDEGRLLQREIAAQFNIDQSMVSRIRNGGRYTYDV